ncbi:MAG: hypothetical protein GC168_12725 [Candidatus Hydrogenedens sp.]|nr:hypothetical protein [Candidatus Hydrogenedens sp.]
MVLLRHTNPLWRFRIMRRYALPLLTVFLVLGSLTASAGLSEYVAAPDDSYKYEITETRDLGASTAYSVRLTSQTWHDIVWQHWLAVIVPKNLSDKDGALLLISGGDNDSTGPKYGSSEFASLQNAAAGTQSIVAVLAQVPNQPLFGDMHEDEIIAYTHEQYVDGKGDDWSLLFPMVKSAVRAMDTIAAIAKEKNDKTVDRFVLTGASKRGWTTWLTSAVDKRVAALAPIVIDVLNMEPQMKRQMEIYGGYSEEVADYTERDLQSRMDSPKGRELLGQVDPYSHRAEITQPKLIVNGTNDPYWTVDASNLYFDDLTGEKRLYYQANTGHDINLTGATTITEFYRCALTGDAFPALHWQQNPDNLNRLVLNWERDGGTLMLWTATSPNRDFRQSEWSSKIVNSDKTAEVTVDTPEEGYLAYYAEVRFTGPMAPFGVCSKMTVVPDTIPAEGTRTYELQKQQAAKAE